MTFDPLQQHTKRLLVTQCGRHFFDCEPFVYQPLACGIPYQEAGFAANAFDLSPIEKGKSIHPFPGDEQRELDTGRADIECENHVGHAFALRVLCASNRASAQEAICARELSARLVNMMAARAPTTMPLDCASARYSNCIAPSSPLSVYQDICIFYL